MPIATIEKLAAKIPGLKLINAYGATETTSPSTLMPGELTAAHIDSVGLPCPGVQIVVMDADGRELPRGEIGEIWIGGAQVIRGYWNNPTATAESFAGGFWHSGDLGSIDADNFVRVFRSPEGYDQPRRPQDLLRRGRNPCWHLTRAWSRSAIIAKPCPVLGEAGPCGGRDTR